MCELFCECGVGEMLFNLSGHVQNDIISSIKPKFLLLFYVEDDDTNLTAFVVFKGGNDPILDFSVNKKAKISKILFFLFFLFSVT